MKVNLLKFVSLALGLAVTRSAGEPVSLQQVVDPEYMQPSVTRTFRIEYIGKISDVPPQTKTLRVWMPVPQNSTVQSIRDLTFSRSPRLTTDSKYGNRIAFWEFHEPAAEIELTVTFVCTRREVLIELSKLGVDGVDPADEFRALKQPEKLVLVDDEIRKIARDVASSKGSTLEKGRAIYDYVLGKMTYDKNHFGWGLGSTRHACEVGKGNCTDFHALFNSLCRAQGIASGFEIGLYLPYERGANEPLGGYHCWAYFRVPGKTWVPVDCSEADRWTERREYFFGGHTSNRVAFSTGRDLVLEPPQAGEPLNYFIAPYAEADGQPVTAEKTWSYTDLE